MRGSSPLARGLPLHRGTVDRSTGIIPARAGFTGADNFQLLRHRDHPRSRGVYPMRRLRRYMTAGSSPLARGLHINSHGAYHVVGIIPARAGFTRTTGRSWRRWTDHPRSRGVYTGWSCGCHTPQGSSPLARGLRLHPRPARRGHGIIPARAGFTMVSPRFAAAFGGSSPLARGLRSWCSWCAPCVGIIPARAGFTRAPA